MRCFHPNISGVEAETLLLQRGFDGSYLVRPSASNPGEFTLSVRLNSNVTHIKIHNDGDCYCLLGGEKFATLLELIQFYTENDNKITSKNGDRIDLIYPLNSADPTSERWYHGQLNGRIAEKYLMEEGTNGSYLVRESQSKPGDFVLSVLMGNKTTHFIIRQDGAFFDFGGGKKFESLTDLIEHCKVSPMVEQSGAVVHLINPFNATRITASSIENRVKELDNQNNNLVKSGFWEEFEQLQMISRNSLSRKVGSLEENRNKNRYKNILPFDQTRVVLKNGDPDIRGSDYINANIIKNTDEKIISKRYIATQGCLPHTIIDFWRMVWQENSRIIVMTTKARERGKNKCAQYWPGREPHIFELYGGHTLTIKLHSEQENEDFISREIQISMDEDERMVYQFHFLQWPDHGTPQSPCSALNFLHEINIRYDKLPSVPERGPIVVHCSAGIGRTGTFIAIDMILNQIKMQGLDAEVDIQKLINMLRSQRSGLVQTEAQYKFVYLAIQNNIEISMKRLAAEQKCQEVDREYTNIQFDLPGAPSKSRLNGSDAQRKKKVPRKCPDLPSVPANADQVKFSQKLRSDVKKTYENVPNFSQMSIADKNAKT